MKLSQLVLSLARRILNPMLVVFTAVVSPISMSIAADDTKSAGSAACEVSARSTGLVLLSCPRGLDQQGLADAGRLACANKKKNACNVWIWDDPANIPAEAPETDAYLPKGSRASAVGVWVDDAQQLLVLKKVK